MRGIMIKSDNCIGCSLCALTCSVIYNDEFNIGNSYIRVNKKDMEGSFEIVISSECKQCYQCVKACPNGCLIREEEVSE